jgi:DNA-binding NarL/FixJ family response regulator
VATPHVVVYDSELNVESMSECIGLFFGQWPDLWSAEDAEVPAAVTEFVRGLVARPESDGAVLTGLLRPTLIVDVVKTAQAGRPAIVAAFDTFAVRDPVRVAAQRYDLTAREQDVLRLLLMGLGATEMADRLGLSEMTVHAYYTRLRRKTSARNLSGMIATLLGWSDADPA